ncbi:histidinol-phosphate aminotransferase [Luteitalea sp. TBR-22]|uniref:pyridoxal phosphate-dependent aminotransferase n=1 Tax=Luteitalea sp. TBR-22 TaxID=2802971 RepID=UPI001AF8B01D|nr:histidinol-phosphate transaminase [Luteitalea sp. TBR-22]BCS35871.1 histidinol-phosphate aminotransferase [Luteitalea sp. TBR-22]
MSSTPDVYAYDRADAPADALRLHLNEHTGGCSPAVVEAIARVSRETIAKYPDYTRVTQAVADHLDVPPARVVLTNGLDEGIFAAALAQLRATPGVAAGLARQAGIGPDAARGASPAPTSGDLSEAVIIEPAFGMYADAVEAVGGTVVRVMPGPELSLDREAIAAAVTPRTGVLFIASPGNPSGISLTRDEVAWLSSILPPGALLLLDEAYVEFGGESAIPLIDTYPNMVVGRTFAKAYGLAGMRVGALVGREDVITRMRRVLPPYSLNVFVVAALEAALADRAYMDDYRAQVRESRALLYAACDRWGLPYVRSEANFVLVRAGNRRQALLDGLQARNIYIRDRDSQPGCQGCVRVTTGLVAHTRACIDAMEEILCARA